MTVHHHPSLAPLDAEPRPARLEDVIEELRKIRVLLKEVIAQLDGDKKLQELFSVAETAEILGITPKSVPKLIRSEVLPSRSCPVVRAVRIRKEHIDAYIEDFPSGKLTV